MSFSLQNLEAFILLLTDKRTSRLVSLQDRIELEKLIDPLPDDLEKLSSQIAGWYEQKPKILDAQLELLNDLLSGKISFNRAPGSTQGNVNQPKVNLNKETLRNAIHDSSGGSSQPRKSTS